MKPSDPNLLKVTVPARRDQLSRVRDRMRRWLSDQDISTSLCADIVLATDEAMANSVEHAYGQPNGSAVINLAVRVDPDTVSVSVIDHGRWRQPAAQHTGTRGRGLSMIRALAGRVELNHTSHGTALTAHFPRQP